MVNVNFGASSIFMSYSSVQIVMSPKENNIGLHSVTITLTDNN
jgi:hypothetical protein